MCEVSSNINPGTLRYQLISFSYKNHLFNAIDTPGLDNSDSNNKNIEQINNLLINYPKIKILILIKRYNDLRLSGSMHNAIINYMNAFPTRKFWEHVIVVNTYANKHSEDFKVFYRNDYESFAHKINDCSNLKNIMSQKEIDFPVKIKEYFVDSTKINKYEDIAEDFDKIKEDIKNNCLMFKDIIISDDLEKVDESEKKEGFFIVTKYKEIKYIDLDDTEIKIEKL